MKKLTYLLLLISIQFYGQGLKLTPEDEYNTFPKLPAEKFGFASNLPYQYSLEKYVPPVRYQEGGTCVGFASFYYGLSTMYNAKFNLTSSDEKYAHSFDPYFIYSIVFNGTEDCDSGLYFKDAFSRLYNIGAKKLFYPPFTNCSTKWTNEKLKSSCAHLFSLTSITSYAWCVYTHCETRCGPSPSDTSEACPYSNDVAKCQSSIKVSRLNRFRD